jgi:hypothetical protein
VFSPINSPNLPPPIHFPTPDTTYHIAARLKTNPPIQFRRAIKSPESGEWGIIGAKTLWTALAFLRNASIQNAALLTILIICERSLIRRRLAH